MKLNHHLGNVPKCETCPKVQEHLKKMREELRKIREKDSRKMGGDLASYIHMSIILGEKSGES